MVSDPTDPNRWALDSSLQEAIDGIGDARAIILSRCATGNEHERRLQQMAVRALEAAEKAVYTLHRRAVGLGASTPPPPGDTERDR